MSIMERVILIHYYHAVTVTTLRYPDEVKEPSRFAELRNLPEPCEEELSLMIKIMDKMTKDMDLGA